jgi:hypothetical protein
MRGVIDPYDPAHVDWGPYLDVCGVVHWSWRRAARRMVGPGAVIL